MNFESVLLLKGLDAFFLVFVRMTGLFVVTPIFGRRNVPVYMKIAFSILLSLILINTIQVPDLQDYNHILGYFILTFKELMVGITLGYVSYLIFTAIYLAGQIIDMQVGFGVVSVLDPVSNIQIPVTANFYYIISMMFFLILDGHHVLIQALFGSFTLVPLGGAVFTGSLLDDIIRIFSSSFIIGFKISAPVVAAVLITDVALGLISKTIPQMNIFFVGMPLKIMLGIAIIILTIPAFIGITDFLMQGMGNEMVRFLQDMGQKR